MSSCPPCLLGEKAYFIFSLLRGVECALGINRRLERHRTPPSARGHCSNRACPVRDPSRPQSHRRWGRSIVRWYRVRCSKSSQRSAFKGLHGIRTGASSSCSGPLFKERRQVTFGIKTEGRTGKVEGDTKGRAELVVASIAFSDGRVGIVDSGKDAGFAELVGCLSRGVSEGTRR